MRLNIGIIALVLVGTLSACGSSSGASSSDSKTTPAAASSTPTVSTPDIGSLDCAKYVNTARQIAQAQSNMLSGSAADFATAVDALKAEFTALKSGAPSDVKTAIDDLASALTDIGKLRANPATADQSHLQTLATRLPADAQKISTYIASNCHA